MSACVEWKGTICQSTGYGVANLDAKRHPPAHRWVWEQAYGPIPPGLQIRHYVCGNRRCVALDHLRLGTAKDNADDRERDGHTARGERQGASKLTAAQVVEIHERHVAGESMKALGRAFGVSDTNVKFIVTRKYWRHV